MNTKIPIEVRRYMSELGKKGGKARMEKMTPEERSRIAKLGNDARQSKARHAK